MNKKVIIAKDNLIAYNYLVDNFASCGIKFKIKQSKLYYFINVELDKGLNEIFINYIAKAIILSNKYSVIMSVFSEIEYNYANIACISALLYFDLEAEIDEVTSIIQNEETISVEGTFDFKLKKLRDEWEELQSIGEVLIYGDSDEDIYNVTNFMITTRVSDKSIFLAGYPDILLANVTDGLMVDSIKIYENNDFNLINAVVAESPTELIIEKNQIKLSLLDCLSKIVKIKIL